MSLYMSLYVLRYVADGGAKHKTCDEFFALTEASPAVRDEIRFSYQGLPRFRRVSPWVPNTVIQSTGTMFIGHQSPLFERNDLIFAVLSPDTKLTRPANIVKSIVHLIVLFQSSQWCQIRSDRQGCELGGCAESPENIRILRGASSEGSFS